MLNIERDDIQNTLRRVNVYSQRSLRTFLGGLKHNCFFMHLPKCGGTSISSALKSSCPLHKKTFQLDITSVRRGLSIYYEDVDSEFSYHPDEKTRNVLHAFQEQLLLTQMAAGTTLILGHFFFSDRAYRHFGTRYKFVTIMRNPLDRAISHYVDERALGNRGKIGNMPFDEYLDTVTARRHTSQNWRYFGGTSELPGGSGNDVVEKAKENMLKFSIVGFTDRMDDFKIRFSKEFGVLLRIPHYRKAAGEKPKLTPEQRARLEQLCAPDMELFEFAREHLS